MRLTALLCAVIFTVGCHTPTSPSHPRTEDEAKVPIAAVIAAIAIVALALPPAVELLDHKWPPE